MARLIPFTGFQDFLRHNSEHMEEHFYVYFHVFKLLPHVKNNEASICRAFNIVDDEGHQIIALHIPGSYYLFSFGWTEPMLELLAAEVDVRKYAEDTPEFEFRGQRDLILAVLHKHPCPWCIFKERLVYQCEAVAGQSSETRAVVKNATYEDGQALVEMSWAFDKHEYPDKVDRDEEKAYWQVKYGIKTSNLFVVKEAGTIRSMLQVIQTEDYERPDTGHPIYAAPTSE